MGKKGTKRKTKWRALPLGEDAGGSGNEEELHDEDQSTNSSLVAQSTGSFKRQTTFYKTTEKSYKQTKRFPFDRYRIKEPLVKLESKTFDEEEYTKITTPRQDVLFKKGYFGRKREFSMEEVARQPGDLDGEEPVMDQLIITNGFVDERGHYLVNGNSYEIYDPYSNTVTVVVGPPPYANGVTQPVLAAVSCQPVPLQPVDWYPPGSDWPSQGSAWTPSFHRDSRVDSLASPGQNCDVAPAFHSPDAQSPAAAYSQPPYVVPGLVFGESPVLNSVPAQANYSSSGNEESAAEDKEKENELKKTRRKSENSIEERCEMETQKMESNEEELIRGKNTPESPLGKKPEAEPKQPEQFGRSVLEAEPPGAKLVEKQSHSTQTVSPERDLPKLIVPGKESHSTQTPPEEMFSSNKKALDTEAQKDKNESNKHKNNISPGIAAEEPNFVRKFQQTKQRDQNLPSKKFQEEYSKKIYQQRTNYSENRKLRMENFNQTEPRGNFNSLKMSYAKKAMTGLEMANEKSTKEANGLTQTVNVEFTNGIKPNQPHVTNGPTQVFYSKQNHSKPPFTDRHYSVEDKRNGNVKNLFVKCRYNCSSPVNEPPGDKSSSKDLKVSEKKIRLESFMTERKSEDIVAEPKSPSEKSSLVSGLSSPTELSSGQNTPPEKLIIKKIEEKVANEINKGVEEKLGQNSIEATKGAKEAKEAKEAEEAEEAEEADEAEEVGAKDNKEMEKSPETLEENQKKNKKKKNKSKAEVESKSTLKKTKTKKKNKKTSEEKSESDTGSSEDGPFLIHFIREKPQDMMFADWKDNKDLISDVSSIVTENEEILKSLGIKGDKLSFSKLPLHSDLLIGWTRPKLTVENIFGPSPFHTDFFIKRNITNMKSTKPEEFFASVVDSTTADKKKDVAKIKKKEAEKIPEKAKLLKDEEKISEESKPSTDEEKVAEEAKLSKKSKPETKKKSSPNKSGSKVRKGGSKTQAAPEVSRESETESESKDVKLGIVEAVSSWLKEQGDSEKVLSLEAVPAETLASLTKETPAETEKKNDKGNPIHASSGREEEADSRKLAGCIRVANVVNDGFKHLDQEFLPKKKTSKKSRMNRSASWDAKLFDARIKKHFKFLTDSASFCQDLISDVRNGLPAKSEYATEELCDPKQSVSKYYTLAPADRAGNPRPAPDSDSDNEVFDALEYKFLTKENLDKQEAKAKSHEETGNASITDSGVHSDMESSEDPPSELPKETPCKLQ